jgi:F-type H+-transporting ATPase subunit delta
MAENTTIARPYAKAAFDFAVEINAINTWTEMLTFAAEVAKNDRVASMLAGSERSQVVSDFFISICGEQLDEKGQNLIKVMAQNERLGVLPDVVELYLEFVADYAQEITAEVTSAAELSEEQQQKVSASLEQRLARKVKLECRVDKSLISGLVIKAGDLVIDSSIKGQLAKLSDTLKA